MRDVPYRLTAALFVLAITTAGCSSIPSKPAQASLPIAVLPDSPLLAAVTTPVPAEEDIFTLTAEQQAEFLQYFTAPERSDEPANRRISRFLAHKLAGFNYQGKNYTARQAYALNSGNCMSLAVLTKALADLVAVDIEFQSIQSGPVFSVADNFMLSSDHVRSFLYDSVDKTTDKNILQFGKPYVVVDYLPTASDITGPRISTQTFIAMYYRNLAADAILQQQYNKALALLKTALQYDSTYGAVVNLLAVVHRRLEQPVLAEQWYNYGIQVSARKASLLSNYAMLKLQQGQTTAAETMLQQLTELDEADPYIWYWYGKTAMRQQQYPAAVAHFSKAVKQAPYVHQLHLALAQAHYHNNNLAHAYAALQKAAELTAGVDEEHRYLAKMHALELARRNR